MISYIERNPNLIFPISKKNEILAMLNSDGFRDVSISRTSFSWGIPVPGDPAHVMYVWLDALVNYLSAIGFPDAENPRIEYWSPDVHLVGKEIVKFHAIYWLAFLMAAGVELPTRIVSHGWWTVEGRKISKSDGNTISYRDVLWEKFSVDDGHFSDELHDHGVDAFRYFLLREMPFGNDGDFSNKSFMQRYNSELANDLGNLAQRCLVFIHNKCNGLVNQPETPNEKDLELIKLVDTTTRATVGALNQMDFQRALVHVWELVSATNVYFANSEPWKLQKENVDRMNAVLYFTVYSLRAIAILLHPFMPKTMNYLLFQMNIDRWDDGIQENPKLEDIVSPLEIKLSKIFAPIPIFPKPRA